MYNRNLIEYLPEFLRELREYKAILTDGVQPEVAELFQAIEEALNNQFIQSANEYGVSRWEKMLGIAPKSTYSLDERKFTILTKMNEQLPYTTRSMEKRLASLCGEGNYSVGIDANNFTLNVGVALTAQNSYKDVYAMLEKVVPANMVINLYLIYEQNKNWSTYTHEQLSAYTHHVLRNGVY
ncbi:MAG: DUF2313 domain-containing protein [Clostridia bacterium]|nr:DUF2313 domain-containing protein [Clostridia bacterium]